jgi:hypothetical protein
VGVWSIVLGFFATIVERAKEATTRGIALAMLLTAENDDDDDDDSHIDDERRRTADDSSAIPTWNEKLARFASSWLSLAVSLSVLLVAFATQQAAISSSTTSPPEASSVLAGGGAMRQPTINALPAEVSAYTSYEHLGPKPVLGSPRIFNIIAQVLTAESSSLLLNATHLDAYRHDGVICLRGLLPDDLVAQLDTETAAIVAERVAQDGPPKKHSQFHTVEHSALFRNININSSNMSVSTTTKDFPALLQAALFSNISRVAAELLGLVATVKEDEVEEASSSQRNLRVIRDIFLAKDNEEYTCGWHVDDVRTHK